MAARSSIRTLRAPGRLVVNPTTEFADGTFPYGGTEVGSVRGAVLRALGTNFAVFNEVRGEISDILESNHRWTFSCFLRGWDADALELLFADGYELGDISGQATFAVPGAQVPGASANNRAVVLAYIPDDKIHAPAVLLYKAIPDWSEAAEIAFQRGSELGIPLSFECLRDDSDRIIRVSRLPDLAIA